LKIKGILKNEAFKQIDDFLNVTRNIDRILFEFMLWPKKIVLQC